MEGPGKAKVRMAVTLCVGVAGRLCQRAIGKPADIAVAVQLAPGKTFAVAVIDGDALALQRLRRQHGVGGWRLAQRRERIGNLEFLAFDKTRRLDLAFEIFRGKIAAAPASGADHP